MAVTNNLFVRDDLTDVGAIPSGARTYWTCPDIIPNRLVAVPDPQATFGTPQSYATSPGLDILPSQNNYIYLRAKNLYTGGAASGQVALYWCKSSLFMNTGLWSTQSIPAVTGPTAPIAAATTGAIAVAQSAFLWLAPPQPNNYHYCLIARLITDTPPNPDPIPPNFSSDAAYVAWVLNNPQVAFRNVTISSAATPSRQFTYFIENTNDTDEQYLIIADCTNLPNGSTVSFSCAAGGPTPPINVAGTITSSIQSFTTPPTTLPAQFSGDLVVTTQCPPNVPFPPNASVAMRYYRIADVVSDRDRPMAKHLMPPIMWGLPKDTPAGSVVRLGEAVVLYQ
jgi:hypothetical protein